MRVNVYEEEMTSDIVLVSKEVTDAEYGTRTFWGVRFYLQSPDVLATGGDDDDRSAVTFWGKDLAFIGGVLSNGAHRALREGRYEELRAQGLPVPQDLASGDDPGDR